jgi:starch phosphorylase
MVTDYLRKFYLPASQQGRRFAEDHFARAKEVAAWKAQVRAAWPSVAIRRLDEPRRRIQFGESVRIEVGVKLAGLSADDVVVELVLASDQPRRRSEREQLRLVHDGTRTDGNEHRFVLDLTPDLCGRIGYAIRAYPCHAMLTHPFELGLMIWV